MCPSNLRVAETRWLSEFPSLRKRCGYVSLRNAFPQSRSCGNVMYIRVSRNGYLHFRLRIFMFPLNNRYETWNVNALFHPVVSAGDFVPLAAEAAQASAIDSTPSSNNSSTASNQTKARKFFSSWMKTYSWLAYDEKEDYMYCKVCTEHKKKNGMCKVARCKNFQNTTLVRHAALSDHQMALQKPQIPKQFEAILKRKSRITAKQSRHGTS